MASSPQAFNLKAAVAYALEYSPTFDTAKKNRDIADDGSLNLGLTENLYDNGVALTNITIADLNQAFAELNFKKSRDSLSLSIATEFYHYSLARILLEMRKQQNAILNKLFHSLANQYRQGLKTKSDYLRFTTQVRRAEIDEPLPVQTQQSSESVLHARAPNFVDFFDFKIAKIQNEINSKSVVLVKRNYWPAATFTSGVNYQNQNYLNTTAPFAAGYQLSWNVLLTLQMKRFLNIFALLLTAIALLALMVGGIGINNMMLVSVTERIKEFGIRKALGATNRSIRVQVLLEWLILCLAAGLIGILLGFVAYELLIFAASKVVPQLKFAWVFDLSAALLSIVSIIAVGIASGFVPALRAEKLQVIEALRTE